MIYLDIHSESRTEGRNLHVVTIGTAPRHLLQMALEHPFHFFRSRGQIGCRCRICASILPFRIPPDATTRVHVNELFIVRGMLTHVVDYTGADFMVRSLIAIELIGEGIEEAIP